jgi:hypothetical protein
MLVRVMMRVRERDWRAPGHGARYGKPSEGTRRPWNLHRGGRHRGDRQPSARISASRQAQRDAKGASE